MRHKVGKWYLIKSSYLSEHGVKQSTVAKLLDNHSSYGFELICKSPFDHDCGGLGKIGHCVWISYEDVNTEYLSIIRELSKEEMKHLWLLEI